MDKSIEMVIVFKLVFFLLLVVVLVDFAGFGLHPTIKLTDHELVS